MIRAASLFSGAAIAAAAVMLAPAASAEVTKAQCIEAHKASQELRRDSKFGEARSQLQICIDTKCPSIVRNDCTKRMAELEAAQPTIIFEAKSGAGADLTAVKVTIDGRPLTDKVDGLAVPIDPGEHTFVFTVAGEEPVTEHFVLREGDKSRHERIVIGKPPPPPPPPKVEPLPVVPAVVADAPKRPSVFDGMQTEPAPRRPMATVKVAGLVTGGVGLAALAVGGVFAGLTASAISAQNADCSGTTAATCTNLAGARSEHTTTNTDSAAATGLLIAGGALAAAGIVMFVWPSHDASERPATSMVVLPSVAPGAAGLLLQGSF